MEIEDAGELKTFEAQPKEGFVYLTAVRYSGNYWCGGPSSMDKNEVMKMLISETTKNGTKIELRTGINGNGRTIYVVQTERKGSEGQTTERATMKARIEVMLSMWGKWAIRRASGALGYPTVSPMFRDAPRGDGFGDAIPLGFAEPDILAVDAAVMQLLT